MSKPKKPNADRGRLMSRAERRNLVIRGKQRANWRLLEREESNRTGTIRVLLPATW